MRASRQKKAAGRLPPEAFVTEQTEEADMNEVDVVLGDEHSIGSNIPKDTDDESESSELTYNSEETLDTAELYEAAEAEVPSSEDGDQPEAQTTTEGNRLFNFVGLKSMIEQRCVCSSCKGPVLLSEMTIGIATTVILVCTDCSETKRRTETGPNTVSGDDVKDQIGLHDVPKRRRNTKKFRDYPLHYTLVLLMQQLGCGLEGIRAVLTHLGLAKTVGDWVKWREITDTVGIVQQSLADEVCERNMKEEIELSANAGLPLQTDTEGVVRQGVAVSVDMGWQKRSSGRRYDSSSGVSLMLGAQTKSIMQRHVCSLVCRVCDEHERRSSATNNTTKNVLKPIRKHRCPKNYDGSSKGMEAHTAVISIRRFFHLSATSDQCLPAFVHTIISDDDSSTWANVQQSLTDRLQHLNECRKREGLPLITKKGCAFWPKDNNGQPKKDLGKLKRTELAPQINLADPNHRTKVLGKHLYALTAESKGSGKQLTKEMAERLKLHFNKALHQNRKNNGEQLRDALLATLEHEFGNHKLCNIAWCKDLMAKDAQERRDLSLRWMNKTSDARLYAPLKKVYLEFLTQKKIEEMHHQYDTQKNESMNQKLARLCPKTQTFSKSMVLGDRVAWVVLEDSVGGEAAVSKIFATLGLGRVPDIVMAYYSANDTRRARHHEYTLRSDVKHHRRRKLNEKMWKERNRRELSRRKGQNYGTGIGVELYQPKEKASADPGDLSSGPPFCTACGQTGHQRRSSKLCPHYKPAQSRQAKNIINGRTGMKDPPLSTTTPTEQDTAAIATRNESKGTTGEATDRPE